MTKNNKIICNFRMIRVNTSQNEPVFKTRLEFSMGYSTISYRIFA